MSTWLSCRDTVDALQYAVGNALASIPGLALPPIGLALLRLTGSWLPLFGGCAALTLGTGIL